MSAARAWELWRRLRRRLVVDVPREVFYRWADRRRELVVPASTIAVVLLRHGDGEDVVARFMESPSRVPAPRRQHARALRQLAAALSREAQDLDAEVMRRAG